jgi:cytidine deaminase
MDRTHAKLVAAARRASARAYAPFSGFRVGAAVLTGKGRVYSGCNVENSSFGLTICAERVAIFKAVSAGDRRIKAIAIFAPSSRRRPETALTAPCGACLQVIHEFGNNPEVILSDGRKTDVCRLRDLLPRGFRMGTVPGRGLPRTAPS